MTKVLFFLFMCSMAMAGTNYVVVVDQAGTRELSSYWTTNSIESIYLKEIPRGIPVFVTKAEYDADKDVDENDRLKNIPKAKITKAISDAPDKTAEAKWNNSTDDRTSTALAGKTKADFIAEYKKEATNTTVSAVSP